MDIQKLKLDLAIAVRMLENIRLLDMNGHVSYRIPGTDRILINSRKASRATLSVKNVITMDLEGNLIEGESEPPSEMHIHTSIYRKRKDVHAVVHNHPHWQTVLFITGQKLQPVFSIGAGVLVDEHIPNYEVSSLINSREMGEQMAEKLGLAHLINIDNHGTTVVDEDIQSVFARCVLLEENAKKQYFASLLGNMKAIEGQNLERTRQTNWTPKIIKKVWDYHKEKAERDRVLAGVEMK